MEAVIPDPMDEEKDMETEGVMDDSVSCTSTGTGMLNSPQLEDTEAMEEEEEDVRWIDGTRVGLNEDPLLSMEPAESVMDEPAEPVNPIRTHSAILPNGATQYVSESSDAVERAVMLEKEDSSDLIEQESNVETGGDDDDERDEDRGEEEGELNGLSQTSSFLRQVAPPSPSLSQPPNEELDDQTSMPPSKTRVETRDVDEEGESSEEDEAEEDEGDTLSTSDPATEAVRKEAMESLKEIESNFDRLRQALYEERMHHLKLEESQIRSGTHPDYLARLQAVEKRKHERVARAEARRRYTAQSAWLEFNDIKFQAEREFIDLRFKSRLERIRQAQKALFQLKAEKRQLECKGPDPKSSAPFVDPTSSLSGAAPTRLYLAKRRKRMKILVDDLRTVQNTIGYPALYVESLSEMEIQNDLHTLQNGLRAMAADAIHFSVFARDSRCLQYRDRLISLGDVINVLIPSSNARFQVKLLQILENEINCQRVDGTKTRIPIAMLRNNSYVIEL